MIRLDLSPEPQWLDLGHGMRLKLLPLTTALMVATRADPAVQDLDPDSSNDARAAIFAGALARRAVVDWEGVGDLEGNILAVSPEGIDALLSLWPIFEAFNMLYVKEWRRSVRRADGSHKWDQRKSLVGRPREMGRHAAQVAC